MAVEAGRMHQARWQGIDVGVVDTAGIVGWQCLLLGITQGPGRGSAGVVGWQWLLMVVRRKEEGRGHAGLLAMLRL